MKTIKLRLILDIEYDPAGEPVKELKGYLYRLVRTGANEGLFTGTSPATVENYSCSVKECKS
jgi:hypothetical protein